MLNTQIQSAINVTGPYAPFALMYVVTLIILFLCIMWGVPLVQDVCLIIFTCVICIGIFSMITGTREFKNTHGFTNPQSSTPALTHTEDISGTLRQAESDSKQLEQY